MWLSSSPLGELLRDAHRLSWTPPSRNGQSFVLTATPHKGDPDNFTLFLQLLDQDAYADVRSIREAMERRHAPFYLRRTKEAMVYFPERQADGTWNARKVFTKRIPRTVSFAIDGDEFELYDEVTKFVRRQSEAAAARGDDSRARAVGFLMALYQRRLASSTYALRHSLENRAKRLGDALKHAEALTREAPPDIPDPSELEELEDSERERLERLLDAITLAGNADQVQEEIQELYNLAEVAQAVEDGNAEAACQSHDRLFRLMIPVRWLTNRSRTRCSACRSSCSGVLVATNFIVGRWTASAIASASRKSFFCPSEYGRTYFAGINRAS
jgi:hypothetical protein